jgi:hypothetical protein
VSYIGWEEHGEGKKKEWVFVEEQNDVVLWVLFF